ncbi:hypothetical protein GF319_03230 [Candidatus Bathyarchaeota archaeon]|nr:hypothetical protein [Candidatus Bathyarchaeota archaeon]
MKNNRIIPFLILILASGLLVSFYFYYDANQALRQTNLEKQTITEDLSELKEECDEVSQELEY